MKQPKSMVQFYGKNTGHFGRIGGVVPPGWRFGSTRGVASPGWRFGGIRGVAPPG